MRELIDRFKLARQENYNMGYSQKSISGRNTSKSLPPARKSYAISTPKEDFDLDGDLDMMLDYEAPAPKKQTYNQTNRLKPEELIRLDEDDFGKY